MKVWYLIDIILWIIYICFFGINVECEWINIFRWFGLEIDVVSFGGSFVCWGVV